MTLTRAVVVAAFALGCALGAAGCSTDQSTEVEELESTETQEAEQPLVDEESEFESEEGELEEGES
jgi:hypothetical protein